jgi:hypothetical protein
LPIFNQLLKSELVAYLGVEDASAESEGEGQFEEVGSDEEMSSDE